MILAHRLLKNSVRSDEYLLLTDEFHALSGFPENQPLEIWKETYDAGEAIGIHVHYPTTAGVRPVRGSASIWRRLRATFRIEAYTIKRLFTKAPPFRHLSAGDPSPGGAH